MTSPGAETVAADPRPPTVAVALLGLVVGLLLSAVGGAVVSATVGYHPTAGSSAPLSVTVGGVVGLWAGLLGAVVVSARRCGAGVVGHVGLRVAGVGDVVGGAGAGLVTQLVLIPLLYLPAEKLFPDLARQLSAPARADAAGVHGVFGVTVLVLVLAVGAPVVEEVYFRGLVLRSLAARTSPWLAVVATAGLFALAHFQAVQAAGLATFGVVLGVLARRSGRLGPSIAAHMAFNALAVATVLGA